MKELIRQRALELGFDDCRFARAQPPEHVRQFQGWLADQRHGEMNYIERNAAKRADPQLVLPGAQTVIALAAGYGAGAGPPDNWVGRATPLGGTGNLPVLAGYQPAEPGRSAGFQVGPSPVEHPSARAGSRSGPNPQSPIGGWPSGIVARYARFADYHDVLGERLKLLTAFVNQLGGAGARSLWYVDTGPVLEREFAQRAGLGFVGKHTNLISRRLGNWIFLAEILTTVQLEPDAPEPNRCGTCVRCIGACPTAAITAPFQLDARRCISYLTIELKGPIPVELRPAIGNRIYGCDDCLAVCPWNRFAREGRLMRPHARPDLEAPELTELLALDEAAFKRRFAGTPMLRVKRRGLLRNVCVALGNVGDASALPALRQAAGDAEPLVAGHARWAIAQIQLRHGR